MPLDVLSSTAVSMSTTSLLLLTSLPNSSDKKENSKNNLMNTGHTLAPVFKKLIKWASGSERTITPRSSRPATELTSKQIKLT